jgi:hypothetical protein
MTYRARTNSARVEGFVNELAGTSEGGESPQFHTSNTQLGGPYEFFVFSAHEGR